MLRLPPNERILLAYSEKNVLALFRSAQALPVASLVPAPSITILSGPGIPVRSITEGVQRAARIVAEECVPIPREENEATDVPYVTKRLHRRRRDVNESYTSGGRHPPRERGDDEPPRMCRRHFPKDRNYDH